MVRLHSKLIRAAPNIPLLALAFREAKPVRIADCRRLGQKAKELALTDRRGRYCYKFAFKPRKRGNWVPAMNRTAIKSILFFVNEIYDGVHRHTQPQPYYLANCCYMVVQFDRREWLPLLRVALPSLIPMFMFYWNEGVPCLAVEGDEHIPAAIKRGEAFAAKHWERLTAWK